MTKFSANLGFLWTDLELPDAIHAAAKAGFDAVECHWPFETPVSAVNSALIDTQLPMLGLNTRRGDVSAGDNGLCAVPSRSEEAKEAIIEAVNYAAEINAKSVHVMAGNANGINADEVFRENLVFAAQLAAPKNITILIEPLNQFDASGYFLKNTQQAKEIITDLALPNVKLMFDCYHVGRTEGNVEKRFQDLKDLIGHIQFASVPDRGRPDQGTINYAEMFRIIAESGWEAPLGAEYKPYGPTDDSLSWMDTFK